MEDLPSIVSLKFDKFNNTGARIFYLICFTSSLRIDRRFVVKYRVKSGNFGHQVNSDMHLQTVEIKMRRLLMSRLIRIFTE